MQTVPDRWEAGSRGGPSVSRRSVRAVLALSFLAMTTLVVSCGGRGRVICDYAPPAYTVKGPLVGRQGSVATYLIDSVWRSQSGFREPPKLLAGQRVNVRYEHGQAQFLRVGDRYRVTLWWISDAGFWSGVHMGDEACSGGTVYADGSPIDTSLWVRSWVRNGVAIAGAVLFVLILLLTSRVIRRRRTPAVGR
jgi:hypothetical protein